MLRQFVETSCKFCKNPDNEQMVQCDNCDSWFHFICVNVTNEVEHEPWMCAACLIGTTQNVAQRATKRSESRRSVFSGDLRKEIPQNVATRKSEKIDGLQQLIGISRRNEFPIQPITTQSRPLNDPEQRSVVSLNSTNSDKTRGTVQQLKMQRLEEERTLKEKRDKEYLDKKYAILSQAGSNYGDKSSQRSAIVKVADWIKTGMDYPKKEVKNSSIGRNPKKQSKEFGTSGNQFGFDRVLSKSQLAARQALNKDLPTFNGNPEEWPLFISSFHFSTDSCGFSNAENLVRLQKALKGKALEAVRSQLLIPELVPEVIETLRILYGKAEIIIHTLLHKVRNEPSPKADKFDSLMNFALAVRNLCATIEAASMKEYNFNPTILQELVDKLPIQIKLNWALHKQTYECVGLVQFSNWLFNVAQAMNDVVTPTSFKHNEVKKRFTNEKADKCLLHTHNDQSKEKSLEGNCQKLDCCPLCNCSDHRLEQCKQFQDLSYNEKWQVLEKFHLCRKCLKPHRSNRCKSKKKCGQFGCEAKHHPLLHKNTQTKLSNEQGQNNCNAHQQTAEKLMFRVVPVVLYGDGMVVDSYAFLDEGSSLTLVDENLADELNLKGTPESLCLRWTADTTRVEEDSRRVSLEISGKDSAKKYYLSNVRTVKNLNLPVQSLSMEKLLVKYPYLKELPVQQYKDVQPKLLIGLDNWKLGLPLEIRERKWKEPVATKTRLGWIIHGPVQTVHTESDSNVQGQIISYHFCGCISADEKLHKQVKEFFSLESLGVEKPKKLLESNDNARARKIMEATTIKKSARFETGLLWRYDEFKFPDSYPMARRRFACLERKMARDTQLAENLKMQIKEYQQKEYARKLTEKERQIISDDMWYLPVFVVINSKKPGKIRMVWDAAATVDGVSLNSMLLTGPDQLSSLLEILYRFRERKIGICGDIREMFHQVMIRKADQKYQCFLWRDEPTQPMDVYALQVMSFGAACSPCSAQYVKNKNAMQYKEKYPRAVSSIINNHYVDDMLDSVDTIEEAIDLSQQVKFIHSMAGFEIHNWLSNSNEVLKELKEGNLIENKNLNINSEGKSDKVLGMWWNTTSDTFGYSLVYCNINPEILRGVRRPTKREVLRILMSIYDPLGLIGSFLVYIKILLQQIWRSSIGWDEQISDEQFRSWLNWIHLLPEISKLKISRCYSPDLSTSDPKDVQIHVFVDASENAFAAVAYYRIVKNESKEVVLIGSKTKVAPMKPMSIPRLELQAALLGARFLNSICGKHSVKISKQFLWSDSKTVLSWIRSDARKYRQFVAFRIAEILDTTEISDWKWVPTKLNVADEATKWQKIPSISGECRWFNGPDFLFEDERNWPTEKQVEEDEIEEEIRFGHVHLITTLHSIVDTTRFSTWEKLLRTLAVVLRFLNNLKLKVQKDQKKMGPFEQKELMEAEKILYRQAQQEAFGEEITKLTRHEQVEKKSNLYKLSPYLDDSGLLRMRGRIDEAIGVEFETKRPIILPKNNSISFLLIDMYHRRFHHHNHETVINEIRQKFVIPQIRVQYNKVRRQCQKCKNKNSKPEYPEMSDLPMQRLIPNSKPFTYVGVDYFGPMQVTVGRRTEKRWGVLFTCFNTRAIHLEIAYSLNTDSCIMAVMNFVARRGYPSEFYSDNGSNFKSSEKELRKEFQKVDKSKFLETFTSSTIKWVFNPPGSPHMGGIWERLVRSVKNTMNHIVASNKFSDELLRSILMEAEYTVNSRPLTFVPVENEDEEALTPNHFLYGSSNGVRSSFQPKDDGAILRKKWLRSQQLANHFWKRWIREYLPIITRRTKWFEKVKPIEVGDVVIVVDEKNPRNHWPKGIVVQTISGRNGQIRQAVVRTTKGLFKRPVVKLAILDIKNEG